jgi:cell division transport system permease protein
VSEAFKNLFRNHLMTVAAILTVSACLFILAVSLCLALNIDYLLEQMEQSLSVVVYLSDELDADQVNELYKRIQDIPYVKADSVKYISHEMAIERFIESMDADPSLLDGLPDNFLPRSFELEAGDLAYRDVVIEELKGLAFRGVEKIGNQEQYVGLLTTINNGIRVVSVIVIAGLIVLSVLIIVNTIKITVNSRRTEITIMKYVGATDWFIRWPFIIEGLLIGLIGAAVPLFFSWLSYRNVLAVLRDNFISVEELFDFKTTFEIFSLLIPLTLILGAGIGIIGSVTSMRKYLRV